MLSLPACAASFQKPFSFFCEIADIPHASHHCEKIADYLENFAKIRNLPCHRDKSHNVLICKPASPGYEQHEPIILQGHTDMVAVKEDGCTKDLLKDGLDLSVDGDMLYAKGTSLGADDGIAVAYILAILDDETLPHPPIEALFTADEEVGLLGANAFDTDLLKGNILLNLDSEDEGVFTFGCAGGVRCDSTLFGKKTRTEQTAYTVTLSGLIGGHSGIEIDKGRASAITSLASILTKLPHFRLVSMEGGSADNAIPTATSVTIVTDKNPADFFKENADLLIKAYKNTENNMEISVVPVPDSLPSWDEETSKRMVSFIADTPFGVLGRSTEIEGLVETSQNPGIVTTNGDALTLTVSVRSSVLQKKEALVTALRERTEALAGHFDTRGDYPAWEYRKESRIREVSSAVYQAMYGKLPKCEVVHAGLECGIFAEKIKNLDAVSFGPDLFDIHSFRERASLSSAARVFDYLKALLKSL